MSETNDETGQAAADPEADETGGAQSGAATRSENDAKQAEPGKPRKPRSPPTIDELNAAIAHQGY